MRLTKGAVKLRAWRQQRKLSQGAAAELIGGSGYMAVSRWERGVLKPSRRSATMIERVTHGAVSVESWDMPHGSSGD